MCGLGETGEGGIYDHIPQVSRKRAPWLFYVLNLLSHLLDYFGAFVGAGLREQLVSGGIDGAYKFASVIVIVATEQHLAVSQVFRFLFNMGYYAEHLFEGPLRRYRCSVFEVAEHNTLYALFPLFHAGRMALTPAIA